MTRPAQTQLLSIVFQYPPHWTGAQAKRLASKALKNLKGERTVAAQKDMKVIVEKGDLTEGVDEAMTQGGRNEFKRSSGPGFGR